MTSQPDEVATLRQFCADLHEFLDKSAGLRRPTLAMLLSIVWLVMVLIENYRTPLESERLWNSYSAMEILVAVYNMVTTLLIYRRANLSRLRNAVLALATFALSTHISDFMDDRRLELSYALSDFVSSMLFFISNSVVFWQIIAGLFAIIFCFIYPQMALNQDRLDHADHAQQPADQRPEAPRPSQAAPAVVENPNEQGDTAVVQQLADLERKFLDTKAPLGARIAELEAMVIAERKQREANASNANIQWRILRLEADRHAEDIVRLETKVESLKVSRQRLLDSVYDLQNKIQKLTRKLAAKVADKPQPVPQKPWQQHPRPSRSDTASQGRKSVRANRAGALVVEQRPQGVSTAASSEALLRSALSRYEPYALDTLLTPAPSHPTAPEPSPAAVAPAQTAPPPPASGAAPTAIAPAPLARPILTPKAPKARQSATAGSATPGGAGASSTSQTTSTSAPAPAARSASRETEQQQATQQRDALCAFLANKIDVSFDDYSAHLVPLHTYFDDLRRRAIGCDPNTIPPTPFGEEFATWSIGQEIIGETDAFVKQLCGLWFGNWMGDCPWDFRWGDGRATQAVRVRDDLMDALVVIKGFLEEPEY